MKGNMIEHNEDIKPLEKEEANDNAVHIGGETTAASYDRVPVT
jgi:hypothetical protein